ncbi:MAG: GntR family transcriptional regulator [Rhodobacteraceae bacterium]|jgi:GntR family transcriptional regulator of vanillate catabolism|nr:GntR family transcriptional regulator [Paracoccaceae bacterium]
MPRPTQSTAALTDLRDMVLSGELAPGERLPEVHLSERLGLSRTPLREALTRLEQEGLLERAPTGLGYVVRGFTWADVADAIEVRGVLEGTAARLAAERGPTPALIDTARDLLARLDAVVTLGPEMLDMVAYADLNAAFHAAILDMARSPVLAREIGRAVALPFAGPSAFLTEQTDVLAFRRTLAGAQDQHHAILDAIAAREGSRAEAIAREHARLARKNLDYVRTVDRALIARIPGLALVKS